MNDASTTTTTSTTTVEEAVMDGCRSGLLTRQVLAAALQLNDLRDDESLMSEQQLMALQYADFRVSSDAGCSVSGFIDPYLPAEVAQAPLVANVSMCRQRLFDSFPLLEDVLLVDPEHTFVAGGALLGAIFDKEANQYECKSRDVDIWYVGLPEEGATALLEQQVSILMDRGPAGAYIVRSLHCINVVCGRVVYQFILRLFRNPYQVLTSFDLSLCRVGFTLGAGVCATDLAALSLLSGSVIVDWTRMNTIASQQRIQKYHRKGFRLIFPHVSTQIHNNNPRFGQLQLWRRSSQTMFTSASVLRRLTENRRGYAKSGLGDYGESGYDQKRLARFNFRMLRDGDVDGFSWKANSWRQLMDAPEFIGVGRLSNWLHKATFWRDNYCYYNHNMAYVKWDLEERCSPEYEALILEAQAAKDVDRVQKCAGEWEQIMLDRMRAVRPGPLWEDVSCSQVPTAPWSGYLCRSNREHVGTDYYTKCVLKVPFELKAVLFQMRKQYCIPLDVWKIILLYTRRCFAERCLQAFFQLNSTYFRSQKV